MGRHPHRRGASLPAIPYSFIRKHHVPRSGWADALTDVVLHPQQSLVSSSGGTTSPGPDGPTPALTWCFTPRNPLFLRPEAPRPQVRMGRHRHRRGAPSPANPYSIVAGHHVLDPEREYERHDVVLHCPQNLVSSFPLHHVFGPFRSFNPSDLVQRLPQNLISPFPLHQVFGPFRSSTPSDLVHESPQNLL